jgi:hypothetical protein
LTATPKAWWWAYLANDPVQRAMILITCYHEYVPKAVRVPVMMYVTGIPMKKQHERSENLRELLLASGKSCASPSWTKFHWFSFVLKQMLRRLPSSKMLLRAFPAARTHGAEPFLRSGQLCSQHFMEPEGSLWSSQEPPLVPILSHINQIHTVPSSPRSILILLTHLRHGLPSGLFPSSSPTLTIKIHQTPSL